MWRTVPAATARLSIHQLRNNLTATCAGLSAPSAKRIVSRPLMQVRFAGVVRLTFFPSPHSQRRVLFRDCNANQDVCAKGVDRPRRLCHRLTMCVAACPPFSCLVFVPDEEDILRQNMNVVVKKLVLHPADCFDQQCVALPSLSFYVNP